MSAIPQKRSYKDAKMANITPSDRQSAFLPMFEVFRTELDEHHDRRERIIKASRDITAASKKMCANVRNNINFVWKADM